MLVNFFDTVVDIKDLQYGVVVQGTQWVEGKKLPDDIKIGHIVGFSRNPQDELLLVVRYVFDGICHEIHLTNLIFDIK